MTRATVKLYQAGNLVGESAIQTTDPDGQSVEVTDQLIDDWTNEFRTNSLTLAALKIDSWDSIEFNIDGVTHTRTY